MNLRKIAEEYGVSEQLLQKFNESGLFDNLTAEIDTKTVSKRLSDCICLYSIGLELSTINEYLQLEQAQVKIDILNQLRKQKLTSIHDTKAKLDYIDKIIKEIC